MTMDLVDVFNKKLHELVDDVCRVCPTCADLKLGLNIALLADRMTALRVFIRHGDQYDEHVLARDDGVFLSDQFDLPDTGVPGINSFDVIQRLKGVWSCFTEDERDIVWKYLTCLVVLKQRFKAASG